MPYRVVRGEVRLFYTGERKVGSKPDGDSAWFKPDNPKHLRGIGHRDAKLNGGGFAQLRFEGIDALELHYPGSDHQRAQESVGARNFLLTKLGFPTKHVEYAPDPDIPRTVRSSVPQSVRAHILTRAIDPYQRPVAFVFPGNPKEHSGGDAYLDAARLDKSLNAGLIREGHAYPGYYSARFENGERVGGLPPDLRNHLTALADDAYNKSQKGVWGVDKTMTGAKVTKKADLTTLAIWPKLYRRLSSWYDDKKAKHGNLTHFRDWLHADRKKRDDELVVLSTGEILNLSDILDVKATTIAMRFWPEDLLIVPR